METPATPLAAALRSFEREYMQFPMRVYCDAACVAYNIADAPPNKYSVTNDPIPYVRFLFAGKKEQTPKGFMASPAKWTEWVIIAKGANAKLSKLFSGVKNAYGIICEDEQQLFTLPFQIMIAPKTNPEYSQIMHIKDGNADVSGIFYEKTLKFKPFTYIYGTVCPIRYAVVKTKEGIKTITEFTNSTPPKKQSQWSEYDNLPY